MSLFLLSAAASCVYVFLRALQQLNVVGGHYFRVVPTSIAMGVGDVVLIMLMIKADSLWIGVSNGIAAGIGCIAAMYLTKRLKGKANA